MRFRLRGKVSAEGQITMSSSNGGSSLRFFGKIASNRRLQGRWAGTIRGKRTKGTFAAKR